MKKEILLPAAAWLGGIAGFFLRRWELATAYDPQLHLMRSSPAAWLLYALCGVLVVLFALACRGMGRQTRTPKQWLYAPSGGYIMLVVCAGFVLMASGLAGLWEQSGLYAKDRMRLLTHALCLLGGVTVLMVGRSVYRGLWTRNTPLLFMGPSFCTLIWLVVSYQANARQPETGLFVWQMLSGVAVVLALYGAVTLAMGRGGAGRTCVFSLAGIGLSLTTLADGHPLGFILMYLFALLYLTAQSWMLLRAASDRPWPERMPLGAEEETQTQTEE